jgi:hypothetical protein
MRAGSIRVHAPSRAPSRASGHLKQLPSQNPRNQSPASIAWGREIATTDAEVTARCRLQLPDRFGVELSLDSGLGADGCSVRPGGFSQKTIVSYIRRP